VNDAFGRCRVTHFNKAAVEFSGRTPELGSDKWCVTLKLLRADGTPLPLDQCPMALAIKEGKILRGVEAIAERPDGTRVWFTPYPTPLWDSEGKLVGGINMLVDITDRKRAEEQLRKRNQRQELLSEALANLLSSRTPRDAVRELFTKVAAHLGVDTYFNFMVNEQGDALRLESCAGISEQTAREIEQLEFGQAICGTVAQTCQPIVASDIQNSAYDKAELVRRFGIQVYACNPLMSGDRLIGTLSFASRTRRHFEEDELEFMRLIARYVSVAMERARAEEKLRQSEERLERTVLERTAALRETIGELESFSYSIVHDMRAPLRSMQGFSHVLLTDFNAILGEKGAFYLKRISDSAERMDRLIQDVLSFSRIARAELKLEPVNTDTLVRDIVDTYPNLRAEQENILIEGTLPTVVGNEAALTQCFSNLLGSAVKFVLPGKRPVIRVWAERVDGRARIFVQDKGIGIPTHSHQRIFELFQRATDDYEGTGIGLPIVKKSVERMGGSVAVSSQPGNGSTFWIELSLAEG
jgi:signal transduction histidine kinase